MFKPQINPNYRTHWDGPILVIEDFLLNIDDFRESLFERGGFTHNRDNPHVVDVGPAHDWRQILGATEFPAEFNVEIAKLQRMDRPVNNYGTNLFYSDMQIEARKLRSSNYPHTDHVVGDGNIPIVFNLWLHDGGGGTGFYTFDGFHTSCAMDEDHRYFAENYTDHKQAGRDLVQYNSYFHGNGEWTLWKVAEMKKNRAFVYCGDFWHRVLIPENEFNHPNPRYSFLCFANSAPDNFLRESGSLGFLSK